MGLDQCFQMMGEDGERIFAEWHFRKNWELHNWIMERVDGGREPVLFAGSFSVDASDIRALLAAISLATDQTDPDPESEERIQYYNDIDDVSKIVAMCIDLLDSDELFSHCFRKSWPLDSILYYHFSL